MAASSPTSCRATAATGSAAIVFANFANEDFQADNLDDDLRSQGLTVVNKTKKLVDVNPSFGGPLRQDKLWFHAAFRYVVTDNYVGGLYYNATPTAWTFTPDLSRPAISDQVTYDTTLNLTWQMSPNNRLSVFGTYDNLCLCHFSISPTVAPEAATYNPGDSSIVQGRWTSTLSNKLLVEAGASHYLSSFPRRPQPDATEPSILEQSTNLRFRSGATYFPDAADGGRLSRVGLLRHRRAQPQGRLHLPVAVRQGSRSCSRSATSTTAR